MNIKENGLRIQRCFLTFFMLTILGLGSLISWSISASFLVAAPFAGLIHRCLPMTPMSKFFLIPGLFLITVVAIWLFYAVVSGYRQHRSLLHFLKDLSFSSNWPEKLRLAVEFNKIRTPVDYTLAEHNLAFTYGLFSPRIVISKSLVQNLDPDELSAILLHEESHSMHKDPLRFFLVKMAFSCIRKIKLIPKLMESLQLNAELSADYSAMTRLGEKSWALASALLKIVQTDTAVPSISIGAATILESRIDFFINPRQRRARSLSKLDYLILGIYLLLTISVLLYTLPDLIIWAACH